MIYFIHIFTQGGSIMEKKYNIFFIFLLITCLFSVLVSVFMLYGVFFPQKAIITAPKNEIEEIHTALYLTEFNYPMILDSVGAFRSQNPHIPTNRMFHNFLIDEKGHIIFVGNPLLSDESSALFKETVEDYLNQNS